MKSMTPVVLATHKQSSLENNNINTNNRSAPPENETQSGELSTRVTTSRESAIKEVGSDFEHEGEEEKPRMGQNGSQESDGKEVRSIHKQNTNNSIYTHLLMNTMNRNLIHSETHWYPIILNRWSFSFILSYKRHAIALQNYGKLVLYKTKFLLLLKFQSGF